MQGFFVDLIDFSAAPAQGTGKDVGLDPTDDNEKYILVVQRVFDRKLWTVALTNKRPETVAAAAGDILLNRIDGQIGSVTSDGGAEFGEPFKKMLRDKDIVVHTKQKNDINAISTIDVAIGRLKKALARVARQRQTDDWASILASVTRGQNAIPNNSYLEGNAPNDVEHNNNLRKELREKNSEFAQHNRKAAEGRKTKLESAGQFRIMLDTGGRFTRGFKPKWSDKVYKLERVDGAFVYDDEGNEYLSKFVLPVIGNIEDLPARHMEAAGSAQFDARRKRVLQDLADAVKVWIGDRRVTLMQVGVYVKRHDFQRLALEARLNMKSPKSIF